MEDSITSSAMNSSFCSTEGSASSEESGWTMYFEDYMASQKRREGGFSSSDASGPSSVISDAASYAAWKPSESERSRKLSLEKIRKGRSFPDDDDSLEDTASSSVNSSKVCELRPISMNGRKKDDDHRNTAQEECVGCGNDWELRKENVEVFDFIESSNKCADLNKRGLCLVPLSLLVDYLG